VELECRVPERPSGRLVGGLSLGLLLGVLGGWLAGLLRAPRPERQR
jgi:NhaP-type Na+/H+ or K+/H+ antiporter